MKKFLSLVLALIMTMSLVTIGAGAKEFTDDEKITYEEAVNVISEIGVVSGYPDGTFKPQDVLTRGAAAKIICNMILGPTTAAELRADTAPFKDVPTNHTFAGYIAYCAKEGIISGYADGTFKPGNTLTGYAFMKMLLGALGYDATSEGYVGANWSINVAKQALNIGLNKSLEGEFNGVKAVNREEACLYAFNTLKADLVEYETIVSTTINGQVVNIGNSIAKAQTWQNSATRKNNIKADNYIQFAEQYFTKLYLTEDVDVFGRPDREWEYDGKDIGTYVNYDLLVGEYTKKVTGLDLYTLLGKSTIEDYTTTVYVDGLENTAANKSTLGDAYFTDADMNKNNKEKVGETGKGVLTQVFQDTDDKEVTVAIINTYLAIASSDYNEKKETASFDVYALEKVSVGGSTEYIKNTKKDVPLDASLDDFDVEGVEEDDAYLVNVADGEIQIMQKAEVVEDAEISSFKLGDNVTADGTKYDYAATALYDDEVLDQYTDTVINLKDKTYNVYLDQYGYLIGIDLVDDDDNYVFITGIDTNYSNLYNKTVDAAGIFTDGTMDTIKVDTKKSTGLDSRRPDSNAATLNSWFTYTVSSDGVYTLKLVPSVNDNAANTPKSDANPGKTAQYAQQKPQKDIIDKKNVWLAGAPTAGEYAKVYGNDKTVYLTASIKEIYSNVANGQTDIIIDDVDSVTVGIKNANIDIWADTSEDVQKVERELTPDSATQSAGVYTLYKNNGYIIATVVVGEDAAASKNLVYAHEKKIESEGYDKTADEWTWTRKVIYQGEEVEIKEVGDALTYLNQMSQYKWYQVKFNANDEVISVEPASTALKQYEYVGDIKELDDAVDEEDTVLYSQSFEKDQPSMKANTLYVNKTLKDMNGFHVSDDVKIVLIQFNKNKEETEYYTGADKLEDIIDTLNEKNGNYSYQISAILEDGDATVVVIHDETNTYETGDTTGKGEYITWTGNVFSNGLARITYTVKRPEYIKVTNKLDYSFDIMVNGELYYTVEDSIDPNATSNSDVWTSASGFWWMPLDTDDVVTVENLKFKMANQGILIKYVDEDGDEIKTSSSWESVSATTSGSAISFTIDDTVYSAGDADYVITNATGTDGKKVSGTAIVGTLETVAQIIPDGDDFVYVVVSGLKKPTPTYNITVDTGNISTLGDLGVTDTTDAAKTISITPAKSESIEAGTLVDVVVKVKKTENAAYEISIEKLGLKKLVVDATTDPSGNTDVEETVTVPVTKDIKIEAKDIVVKELDKVQITEVKWSENTITVKFDGAVDKTLAEDDTVITFNDGITGSAVSTSAVLNNSGNLLTITVKNGKPAANNTLTIDFSSLVDAHGIALDTSNLSATAKSGTITLAADGKTDAI